VPETTALSDTKPPAEAGGPVGWGPILEAVIPLAALVLIIIATAVCERVKDGTSYFLTPDNLLNVMRAMAPVGVVAIGMSFAIIVGGIDLSVGSIVGMAGTVGMWIMLHEKSMADGPVILLGMLAMVGVGVLAGLLNGVLIAKGKIAPFIATLGGLAAYRSIAQTIADNGTINVDNHYLADLGKHGIHVPFLSNGSVPLELHYPTVIFFLLAIVAAIVLNRMRFGRYVLAIGGNERAAVYSAINVGNVKILTYTAVGFFCGVGAILFSARQRSVSSVQAGQLFELDAIAAVVIGGTRMSGGSGSIFGTVIGVLILGVINNMLTFLNIPDTLQGLVKGVIIVGAVLVQRMGRRA
jgi:ribose transport system permease protein